MNNIESYIAGWRDRAVSMPTTEQDAYFEEFLSQAYERIYRVRENAHRRSQDTNKMMVFDLKFPSMVLEALTPILKGMDLMYRKDLVRNVTLMVIEDPLVNPSRKIIRIYKENKTNE